MLRVSHPQKQQKNSRFLLATNNDDDDDVKTDELATVQSDFKPLSFGDTKMRKESPHHDRYTTISFFEKCYI